MLCTATETQRASLMRDVRARAEDLDVAGESNRRLSGWAEGEKIEGGHETGDAADESWDATVGFLAHLKLPLGLKTMVMIHTSLFTSRGCAIAIPLFVRIRRGSTLVALVISSRGPRL